MKKTLIIVGHPSKQSFSSHLAEHYCDGCVSADKTVKRINLNELDFSPFLKNGYSEEQYIEEDIQEAQNLIQWAEHLVFIYPTWWATPPALMKAFIERTLIPGFAFKYKKSKKVVAWDSYLTGKTARIISTMDSPPLYYRFLVGDPGFKMMKDILTFCGVKPVKRTYYGSVKMSTEDKRKEWLSHCFELGRKD